MNILSALLLLSLSLIVFLDVESFTISQATRLTGNKINDSVLLKRSSSTIHNTKTSNLFMAEDNNSNGVVELVDDEETTQTSSAPLSNNGGNAPSPFLSQGEIDKEALELTNDPKQTRVIIYIVLSLIPVLFLIPLMLGSRDLIPMDALPPVDM